MPKDGKINLPLPGRLRIVMYVIAFFMWPVGLIGAIVLLGNNNPENRLFGQTVLVFSLVMMVISFILGNFYSP